MPPTPTTWRLSSRGRALPPPASVFCNNADNYIVRCGVPRRGRAQQSGDVCAHGVHCDLFRSPPTPTSHTHDTFTTLISIKVSPLFSSALLLLTVTSDLELEAVWQQRPGGVPGEAVVEGARVEAGHRDVEDPGETPGHRVLLLYCTALHCTALHLGTVYSLLASWPHMRSTLSRAPVILSTVHRRSCHAAQLTATTWGGDTVEPGPAAGHRATDRW